MRLTFPNGEHAVVDLKTGQVAIGSAAQGVNAVVIPGTAPVHARIAAGRRGVWLTVPEAVGAVHVNGRSVRRLALLRAGDLVCLGDVRIQLEADADPPIESRVPPPGARADEPATVPGRAILRGMSGAWFGRSVTLAGIRTLGSGKSCDIRLDGEGIAERHGQIEIQGDRLLLRGGDAGLQTRVNGLTFRDAVLAPGDQLQIGEFRFVLEAPGFPKRGIEAPIREGTAHTRPMDALTLRQEQQAAGRLDAPEPVAVPQAPPRGGLVLLVAAAMALAAALAVLFLYAP